MQNNWILGNVVVDQRVQNERHMVLVDGRHLVFGRELGDFPSCDCLQQAAQQCLHSDAPPAPESVK